MFMKVAAIVFLFLIRLRFLHSKSLSQIIRRRYGDKIIKRLRKFEKIDYRLRKAELDLEFLVKCRDNNVIPKFLNFRLANRSLRFSLTYAHSQSNLNFSIHCKKLDYAYLVHFELFFRDTRNLGILSNEDLGFGCFGFGLFGCRFPVYQHTFRGDRWNFY